MTAKGTKPCGCTACQVKDGCVFTGAEAPGHCCKCLPQRACVSLFTDTDCCGTPAWSQYDPVDSVEAAWCAGAGRNYTGNLTCGDDVVDFSIVFQKDEYTNACSLCLSSTALGYVGDTAICVPMGGEYADPTIKKAECLAMEFSFPVQLYGCSGTITIAPADYVEQTLPRKREPLCLFGRVCITVDDGYTETVQYACRENSGWEILIGDDPAKRVRVDLESALDDPVVRLSLTSYLGDGEEQAANCPTMYAKWTMYDGSVIKIIGDTQAKCADCKCHCRCLCVTYIDDIDTLARVAACRQTEYDGCGTSWTAIVGGHELEFMLQCIIGCETIKTVITLAEPYGTTLVGSGQKTIVCPNGITATWTLSLGGGKTATIEVECKTCGMDCTVDELGTPNDCCPERRIPPMLFATVEGGCSPLIGNGCALINNGPIQAPLNCWSGSFIAGDSWVPPNPGDQCSVTLSLSCGQDSYGNPTWELINGSSGCSPGGVLGQMISCSPLEILFVDVGPEGCCNDKDHDFGVDGKMTIRVTE